MKNKKLKWIFLWVAVSFSIIIIALFFVRLLNHRELDDVSPRIPCEQALLEKADVLWIIPLYENFSISQNKSWCNYILGFNKTLGMHGVTHEYNEFKTDRNQEYLERGIGAFEQCFKFKPSLFKSPQLNISAGNRKLIEDNGLELRSYLNQIDHKVYHCNDSDFIKNWMVDWF